MINKNKKQDRFDLGSNKIVTIQFLLIYLTIITTLSLFSLSTSSAAPVNTKKATAQSALTYDGSEEVAAVPTTLATLRPSTSPTLKPTTSPTVSPKVILTPKPTAIITTPSPVPTENIIQPIILPSPTIEATPLPTATKSSMSQILLALLTILSFAGVVISIILLVANKLKRHRIKPYVIALLVSLAVFIISALFFISIG